MKQKEIIFGVVFVLLLGLGGVYIYTQNASSKPTAPPPVVKEEVIETLKPEDIGLVFEARSDKKAVKIALENLKDIKHFDYEITYEADSSEDETRVTRGIAGEIDIEENMKTYESPYLELGTCSDSSGVRKCRYESGVTKIDLLLKVTKKDNKTYQVEKSLEL